MAPPTREALLESKVEPAEVVLAHVPIALLALRDSTIPESLTPDEAKRIFAPGEIRIAWSDLRPDWPAAGIRRHGSFYGDSMAVLFTWLGQSPPTDRWRYAEDWTQSRSDPGSIAIGWAGPKWAQRNQHRLRIVPIDSGAGPVEPGVEAVRDGSYPIVGRYVLTTTAEALKGAEVRAIVQFHLDRIPEAAAELGLVSLREAEYSRTREALAQFGIR